MYLKLSSPDGCFVEASFCKHPAVTINMLIFTFVLQEPILLTWIDLIINMEK